MLIIQPIGGLCNRMRAINSAYLLAKERGEKLLVIWFVNHELGCPFHELFRETPELKVINIHSKWNLQKMWYQLTSYFVNNETIRQHKGDGLLDEAYRKALPKKVYIATEEHFYPCHDYHLFLPKTEIQERIDRMQERLGEHAVGVHIRRTDNKPAMDNSSTRAFIQAMEREIASNPDTCFYLATDDLSEEAALREHFKDKIVSNENRDLSRDSVSGIKDAMLDLFSLANTTKIIGSYFSSFTDIAADMKGIEKIVAMDIPDAP